MITKNANNKGFTIVELLIVIVVIAILAAISIVAYTGIQQRSRTSAGQATADGVVKKLEALGNIKGGVYTDVTGGRTGAQLNTYANAAPAAPEAVLENPSSVRAAGSTAATHGMSAANSSDGKVVSVYACDGGANVWYWNHQNSSAVRLTAGAGC